MTEPAPRPNRASFLVVVGGDPSRPLRLGDLAERSWTAIVAADSGTDRCVDAGIQPDHVVGDLDSATPEAVRAAEAAGARVHRHEADKDATDLELAIDLVRALADDEPGDLLVVGAGGGRLDHSLADVLLLAGPLLEGWAVRARFGEADLAVARPGVPATIDGGPPGHQVSLLPVHGTASGVTTAGLRWSLVKADLVSGTTRAVSNEVVGGPASVAVAGGVLVVLVPGTDAPAIAPRTGPYDPTPRAGGTP